MTCHTVPVLQQCSTRFELHFLSRNATQTPQFNKDVCVCVCVCVCVYVCVCAHVACILCTEPTHLCQVGFNSTHDLGDVLQIESSEWLIATGAEECETDSFSRSPSGFMGITLLVSKHPIGHLNSRLSHTRREARESIQKQN